MTDVDTTISQLVQIVVSINQNKHWLFTINCGSTMRQKRTEILQAFQDSDCSRCRDLWLCTELILPNTGKCANSYRLCEICNSNNYYYYPADSIVECGAASHVMLAWWGKDRSSLPSVCSFFWRKPECECPYIKAGWNDTSVLRWLPVMATMVNEWFGLCYTSLVHAHKMVWYYIIILFKILIYLVLAL